MYWYDKEPMAGFQLMKCTTKESLKSLLFWLNLATEDLSAKFMLDNYFYNFNNGSAAVVVVVTAGILADFGGALVPVSAQFGADAAGSASGGTLVVVIGGVAVV
jgi:hypothetical protein